MLASHIHHYLNLTGVAVLFTLNPELPVSNLSNTEMLTHVNLTARRMIRLCVLHYLILIQFTK